MIKSKAKKLRLRANLKANQVADRMDMSLNIIYEIENHIDHVKLYNLELYAKVVGCKVKDLFEEE